ncbi:MAG: GNAT family N-acetyltransferase [Desulfobacterales bacterium]|nr:GNAT family N-acetyltransferase [Desulfobacterales bacterium]
MKTISIEKALENDLPRIFQLLEQVNMHHIPSGEMDALTFENYFVARMDGKVVGFCGYKILSATLAKTELMAVDKEYRKYGIGFKLQTRRMEEMLKRGIEKLVTNTDLSQTIAWYKKHFGYREVGRLKKVCEFSSPDIDHWTTLETDLVQWCKERQKEQV